MARIVRNNYFSLPDWQFSWKVSWVQRLPSHCPKCQASACKMNSLKSNNNEKLLIKKFKLKCQPNQLMSAAGSLNLSDIANGHWCARKAAVVENCALPWQAYHLIWHRNSEPVEIPNQKRSTEAQQPHSVHQIFGNPNCRPSTGIMPTTRLHGQTISDLSRKLRSKASPDMLPTASERRIDGKRN